jgi:hypothetical protein
MSDLIRREDVFKAIVGLTTHKTVDEIEILCDASVADSEGWFGGIRDALREVEYIPSAEPERKTGHWEVQPSTGEDRPFIWWKCSECGHVIFSETERDRKEFHAFCGRCGADMRGDR